MAGNILIGDRELYTAFAQHSLAISTRPSSLSAETGRAILGCEVINSSKDGTSLGCYWKHPF
jgi:hypothetical protein